MGLIDLKGISLSYGNDCVFKNIHLSIDEKDYIYIFGPNGGGKTTLLKIILGMVKPSQGEISYKEDIKFGYVPQFSFFDRSYPIQVLDVILMGTLNRKIKIFHKYDYAQRQKAEEIMKKLDIERLKEKQISQLSGGQLQKVLFSRALMTNPNVLILDEPTSNLDSKSKDKIDELLNSISKDMTILRVSHEEQISEYASKIISVQNTVDVRTI